MKNLLVSLSLILIAGLSLAQNTNDEIQLLRDMAATERRALVADNLMMNEEESKIFWPMYDEYRAEMKKIGTRKIETIENFAMNYENMTDEKAIEIMNEYFNIETSYAKLRSTYKDKMLKSLDPQLVFRFFQIENKIDALISLEVANEIPLIIKK